MISLISIGLVIFEALEELGFHLHKAENEYYPQRNYQNGEYRSSVDELELVFYPNEEGVEVLLEFDRRTRGFSGLLSDIDKTFFTRFQRGRRFFSRVPLLGCAAFRQLTS